MTLNRIRPLALIALVALAAPARGDDRAVPGSREQIALSFAPIVKRVAPSVVNIYTRRTVRTRPTLFDDPMFKQFFGDNPGLSRERVQRSLGSGVIVRPDGLIVTNNHVIKDAEAITVVLADRREFEAKLIGADDRTDLALLKIDAAGALLPAMALADSDALEVGDVVLAIGNPFGVGQTVTMGIVSALARTSIGVSDYRFFIQTDAAINPGNSGGALIDMQGRLVGVNSAIFSQTGGSVGIGFAIPANMVETVIDSMAQGGKARRPWLGVGGQAVTSDMYQSLHLERPLGVLVNAVQAGSPAQAAGIKVGDVIESVDGREVDDPEALRYRIATKQIDQSVHLAVMRGGRAQTIEVVLTKPPDIPPRQTTVIEGRNPFEGATVANLNPALAEELGLEGSESGVILLRVQPGRIAARIDLRPGDRILKINGRGIGSVAELLDTVREGGKSWQMAIGRGGHVLNLTINGD